VLHWQGDRIALPPCADLLASSLACPEQLFRLGTNAFGLQFHCELNAASLERWILEDPAFIHAALGAQAPPTCAPPSAPDQHRAAANSRSSAAALRP
jgi:GMP synthase (glutamine-hydrolysing)